MRVALIGHETYENRVEIKDIIFKLNKKFGNDLIIVTRGKKDGIE